MTCKGGRDAGSSLLYSKSGTLTIEICLSLNFYVGLYSIKAHQTDLSVNLSYLLIISVNTNGALNHPVACAIRQCAPTHLCSQLAIP